MTKVTEAAKFGPTLETSELGFYYQKEAWVFRNISLAVKTSSIFAILGPNGCGKTTLLKAFLGLLKPQTGRLAKTGDLALVPQLFQVSFAFTALEMVLMGRAKKISLFGRPSRQDVDLARAALDRFKMANLANRCFQELSGGQRQLVMLARALVAEADILVLDEPTSALDLKNQTMILQCLERLSRENGLTIIFTSHLPQHALAVADDVLLMLDQEYCLGSAQEVMTEENLLNLYGIPIKRVVFDHNSRAITSLVPVYAVLEKE